MRLGGFIGRHPSWVAFLFGLTVVAFLLCALEIVMYVLCLRTAGRESVQETEPPAAWQISELGTQFSPGKRLVQFKKRDGRLLMQSTYTIGPDGLRVTPLRNPESRDKFILVFADSFAFGEGVNDTQTLPCALGRHTRTYRPYNFGFPGHGPQQMYYRLANDMVKEHVKPKSGIAIYLYIDDHLNRACGSMRLYNQWVAHFPCYELDDGALKYRGFFDEARPVRNFIYRLLWKSNTVRYLQLDWPPPTRDVYELTEALIRGSRDEFVRTFPGGKFYVLIYPQPVNRTGARLCELLKRDKVEYLDFDGLFTEQDWSTMLPDGHPSPQMHYKVSRKIVETLKLE